MQKWNRLSAGIFLLSALLIPIPVGAQRDVLSPGVPSLAKIEGILGQKLENCIVNGVMARNFELYSTPFKDKLDDGGGFTGEFWGKWFTSAAVGYAYQPTAAHKAILDKAVSELLKAQDADGRLSSYSKAQEFGFWDIWGRKYALLGLMAHYDQTGDKASLKAACRAADALIDIAGPGKKKLTETGLRILGSLSSCSVLEPVVLVYERSGDKKYLDFAQYLVQLWSEPDSYNPGGLRYVEDALAGVDPVVMAAPKAYEMMSCYEGLCELYRVTGEKQLLDAVVKFGKNVLKKEIMIVGSGSSAELWCDGANRQTQIMEQPMETCVTVTWMKLCYQLLRLTGDPLWADQLEVSLYNALLGAMCDNGNWWAYYSPLIGERMPSPMQVPVCQSSCCVANGPRGLLITPGWSVMRSLSGPVINLYSQGTWSQKLENGTDVKISQETDYPVNGSVLITINPANPVRFTVKLRIPTWSRNTSLVVNDETISCSAGTYESITREWKQGDKIRLVMDLRGRILRAPGSVNDLAVMRGPIVLALDNRFVKAENYNLWLLPDGAKWNHVDELGGLNYVLPKPCTADGMPEQFIQLTPAANKPAGVWMAFEVPFLYRYTHFFNHKQINLIMCDYASAGNQYDEKNLFRVWLPQPLFMNNIFPEKTWRILYGEGDTRPEFPKK
ncbi:MAG: beta-L-arabinofuranosidase domain-containing protein [Bacteroidales bacterium]